MFNIVSVPRPKNASFSSEAKFLTEAQPRLLKTGEVKRHLLAARPKKCYFSSACEYVKLPFSLRAPKKYFLQLLLPHRLFSVPHLRKINYL
jgi:hypothetical protein